MLPFVVIYFVFLFFLFSRNNSNQSRQNMNNQRFIEKINTICEPTVNFTRDDNQVIDIDLGQSFERLHIHHIEM